MRPPTSTLPLLGVKTPAISFRSVDLPEPFCPTMPNVSPGSISKSTSRSAQSSRFGGSFRRRIASFSERSLTTFSVKTRLAERARIRPCSIASISDLDREASFEALDYGESDRGDERAYDEDVDEKRRAGDVALHEHAANPFDVRRHGVPVAEQVDDHRMACRAGQRVEAVEDRRQEEPGQEKDRDEVLNVAEEDCRRRDEPADAERETEEGEEKWDRKQHRNPDGRY